MIQRFFCFVVLALVAQLGLSQTKDSLYFSKENINKPNLLSTHSFGVFFMRLQGHFEMNAPKKTSFNISVESGNVWSPPLKVYIPKNEADREIIREYDWDFAHTAFDENTIEKDSFNISNDGVIKGFKANLNFRLARKHELQIGFRTYLLTKGKTPFSILTGDKFIENFHKDIAGGDDPFDRKVFGLNQANINYTDRNGNNMNINAGDFFATGIETSYYYYPDSFKSKNKTLAFNVGAHLGTNLSKYNQSIDFGLSTNGVKTFKINDKSLINIGLNLGFLRKGLIDFNSSNLEFGTNNFIANLENAVEYSFKTSKNFVHSFGANFYLQTSLNKKDEFEYIIPIRHPDAFKSWGQGALNLYKNNNYWSFIYSFSRKTTTYFYLQQDLTLNNNPDLQTGIGYKFYL